MVVRQSLPPTEIACLGGLCSAGVMRRLLTGVHSSLLDVLHDAADGDVAVLVTEGVHIQLICAVQIFVHQHRPVRVHLHSVLDVPLQVCLPAEQICNPSAKLLR